MVILLSWRYCILRRCFIIYKRMFTNPFDPVLTMFSMINSSIFSTSRNRYSIGKERTKSLWSRAIRWFIEHVCVSICVLRIKAFLFFVLNGLVISALIKNKCTNMCVSISTISEIFFTYRGILRVYRTCGISRVDNWTTNNTGIKYFSCVVLARNLSL